jgi:hypothetical protein
VLFLSFFCYPAEAEKKAGVYDQKDSELMARDWKTKW